MPLSQLIGGEDYAGKGWQMLMECLSIGRSITLPSTASGGAKMRRGRHRRVRAHPQAVRLVGRPFRRRRGSARAHRRQGLRDQRALAGHRRRGRARREPRRAFDDRQVPLHADGPRSHPRRDGRARRQGHHPRPAQLSRPRLAGHADQHHGGRREHHDALADDLRPGRDPVPSVGDEGNEVRAAGRSGRAHRQVRRRAVRPHRLRDFQRRAQPGGSA